MIMANVDVVTHTPDQDYRAGQLLTGQLKARCIQMLQEFVKVFQEVSAFELPSRLCVHLLHIAEKNDYG